MIKPEPHKKPMEIAYTDDGLHLKDSILWFDAHKSGELSFLSSARDLNRTIQTRVITTEETTKILELFRRKPNALVCQYNRPFSIGRLRMELLPSGDTLGGASLYVETENGPLLYAPFVQMRKNPTVRTLQLKKAKTLILGAHKPEPFELPPSRKKEKDRFLNSLAQMCSDKRWPYIFCPTLSTSQELTKLIAEAGFPLAVHNTIYKVNKLYESYGAKLGHYSLFTPKKARQRVSLLPYGTLKRIPGPLNSDQPIFVVSDESNQQDRIPDKSLERFYLSSYCEQTELPELIATVNPHTLYFFGPYCKQYVETFRTICPVVRPLFASDQPLL